MADFDLADIQVSGASGIDALLQREPEMVTAKKEDRRKVGSISDLASFTRLSAETLIHRSERDLWSISKQSDGQFYIQRLFDDNGEPLKG